MDRSKKFKSRTIKLSGAEMVIFCTGSGTAIRNDGTETVYVSGEPDIVKDSDGVVSIPAGTSVVLPTDNAPLYMIGNSAVMMLETKLGENPFKLSAQSGSGAEEDARADETNLRLELYLAGKTGDIRELAHLLPAGGFGGNTLREELSGVVFPIEGDVLITWSKSMFDKSANTLVYGVLTVRSMTSVGDTFICSVFNTSTYTEWQKIADGGNAQTLGSHPASDFALKSDLDALAARVAALE